MGCLLHRNEGMIEAQYRPRSILVNTLLLPFPVDVPVSMWATPERRGAMRMRCPHAHRLRRRTLRVASGNPTPDAGARHCKTPAIRQCSGAPGAPNHTL